MKKRIIIEGEKVHHASYRPFLLRKAGWLRILNYEAENIEENEKQKIIVSLTEKRASSGLRICNPNHQPEELKCQNMDFCFYWF